MDVKIHPTWKEALSEEFNKPYWHTLAETIRTQYLSDTVYPPSSNVFRDTMEKDKQMASHFPSMMASLFLLH